MKLSRRDFLKVPVLAAAAAGATPPTVEKRNGIPYRVLGKTGEKVSLLCVGGYHIGVGAQTDAQSIAIIRSALDEGVNFLDNAWVYNDGRSEERMGKALQDGYREKAFLMTKHYHKLRDAENTKKQLEDSLRRLRTDAIDLWQVHQIMQPEEPRMVYENDVMDVMVKARDEGKVRYIGFTGHSRPEYHQEMLDGGFPWDTVQMPMNAFDWQNPVSFSHRILPQLQEKDIGVIGMKSMGGTPGRFVKDAGLLTAQECLQFSMNMPVATVVSGMDTMYRLKANLDTVRGFAPLGEKEVEAILAKCRDAAVTGEFERYKREKA